MTIDDNDDTMVAFGAEATADQYLSRARWERMMADRVAPLLHGVILARMHLRTAAAYERLAGTCPR